MMTHEMNLIEKIVPQTTPTEQPDSKLMLEYGVNNDEPLVEKSSWQTVPLSEYLNNSLPYIKNEVGQLKFYQSIVAEFIAVYILVICNYHNYY
jgi:hypothetical protein